LGEVSENNIGPTKVGDKYQINVSPGTKSDIQPIKSGDTETYVITHEGASYMSVHFSNFHLPKECSMDVTNGDGTQSSTLTRKGRAQQGTFWAQHVTGDVVKLVLKCPSKTAVFDVDTYAAGNPGLNDFGSDVGERNLRKTSFLEAMNDRKLLSICGADDKRNAICYQNSHSALYDKARAVARLLINGNSACTGWLVSGTNQLFTNEHCISSQNAATNTDYEFMGEEPNCSNTPGDGSWMSNRGDIHDGETLLTFNAAWDYALIQLDSSRNPAAMYGYLELDNRLPPIGELLFIPQHPGGRPKEFGLVDTNENDNECKVKGFRAGCAPRDMQYSCDTEGGSSGSPVLSRTNNKVVALHHCGGGCSGNLGAPITDFYDDIAPYLGGTYPPSSPPVPCTGEYLTITVTADRFPDEIDWTVRNDEGTLLYSEDTFIDGVPVTTTECLIPDCYTFEITDTFGDGICCSYGIGSYTVTLDGTEIKSGGEYSSSESVSFCVDDVTSPTASPSASSSKSPSASPIASPTNTCVDSGFPIAYTAIAGGTSIPCEFVSISCLCFDPDVSSHCPATCDSCADYECVDSDATFYSPQGNTVTCSLFDNITPELRDTYCAIEPVRTTCRATCGFCGP